MHFNQQQYRHWHRFREARGQCRLGSDTEGVEMSGPLVFWQTMPTWHSRQIRVFDRKQAPKFRFNEITSENQGVNKKSEILD